MAEYKVEVTTGDMAYAGTWDHILITLIGTKDQSQKTKLNGWGRNVRAGSSKTCVVKTASSLGTLLLLRLDKDPSVLPSEDLWYCCSVRVWTPEGAALLFPCYRWLSRGEQVELREATAIKIYQEDHTLLKEHRQQELIEKKALYQWKVFEEGLPHCSHFENEEDLPLELQKSHSKSSEKDQAKLTM